MASVFDDGNNVCAMSGHVDEVTAGAVREFDSKDCAFRPDYVRNVRDRCARGSAKVKNFCAWSDENIIKPSQDASSEF